MDSMLLQWITFGAMILIQAIAAGAMVSAIRTTLAEHGKEIERLREWRHRIGPKEMVYDEYGHRLADHESRIRGVERTSHDPEKRRP